MVVLQAGVPNRHCLHHKVWKVGGEELRHERQVARRRRVRLHCRGRVRPRALAGLFGSLHAQAGSNDWKFGGSQPDTPPCRSVDLRHLARARRRHPALRALMRTHPAIVVHHELVAARGVLIGDDAELACSEWGGRGRLYALQALQQCQPCGRPALYGSCLVTLGGRVWRCDWGPAVPG